MSLKKTNTQETVKVKPVAKIRAGLITGSVWERKSDKGMFYSITFERRYKDRDGKWHSSHSYGLDDLLTLAKVADIVHSEIIKSNNDKSE